LNTTTAGRRYLSCDGDRAAEAAGCLDGTRMDSAVWPSEVSVASREPDVTDRAVLPQPSRPAAAIIGALAAAGTRELFGMPGGGPNLDVVGAAERAGLRFVLAHGETAAAVMAATYADLTGAPGAVVVTRGPGLASSVNGIAHAALDRLPLIVIADTVPARERNRISHQRLDQDALARPVAKAVLTLGDSEPERSAGLAVRLATARPPGPVVVNVDAQAGHRASAAPEPSAPEPGAREPAAAGDDLARLARALRDARRLTVLLGADAIAHAGALRKALAGSNVPALHTYRSRGIMPDCSAEAAGMFTGGTMEWPLLSAAGVIVGLGVDPVELIPAAWDYAATTLLVTEYPVGSAAYFTGGAELVAKLPAAIDILAAHATQAGRGWPADAGRTAKQAATARLRRAATAAPGSLAPQDVAATAREIAPPDVVVTVDSGAHMLAVMPLWPVDEPGRLLISSGLATMGFALPAAIGAALARPGRPVIAFTGDGGLGMTLMELETAVRLRLPVVVIVFNDAALSLIKIKQLPEGQGGGEATGYTRTSFAAVATAMGAAAACAASQAQLATALTEALEREGPTLIDARVDPAGYPAILDLTRGDRGRVRDDRYATEAG
jgi:acetolactate synthase I/II/III large subunit